MKHENKASIIGQVYDLDYLYLFNKNILLTILTNLV